MRVLALSILVSAVGPWLNGQVVEPPVAGEPGGRGLAVAWNDGAKGPGMLRIMSTRPPWDFTTPPLEIGRDPVLRYANGRLYAVSEAEDTITVVDPDAWTIERVHLLAEGSEPADIAVANAGTAYITRRLATHLLRLDLSSGAFSEVVDLGVFADADGVPDLGMTAVHEGRLFVQIRRINPSAQEGFLRPAYLVVVDMATEEIIDVDPATPGVQAIELAGTFPKFKMQVVGATRRLFVGATGGAFDEGGIEVVDLDALRSLGMVIREADGLTGADLGPFVMVAPERGYLVYTTDWTISSHLQGFSLSGGVDPLPAVYTAVDYLASILEYDAQGNQFFFPNNSVNSGIHVFDADTGAQGTRDPVPTSGLPMDFVLICPCDGGLGCDCPRFLRGDVDGDGFLRLSDVILTLLRLFASQKPETACEKAMDFDDRDGINMGDVIPLLIHVFVPGSPGPASPFPDCGEDTTPDDVPCRESTTFCEG